MSYTYDGYGNRTAMTYPDGKTARYIYDKMNRLICVEGVDGSITSYKYNALGQRISTNGEKEDTAYAYDKVGNLISQTTTGEHDIAFAYDYDLSGRITAETRTENGATVESSYIYDVLGQLTAFTKSDGYAETYAYDALGNMTAKTADGVKTQYKYNAGNRLIESVTGAEKTKYSYDKVGNLVKKDGAGGSVSYTYNALNLLETWTDGTHTENYTYNASGLLASITTESSTIESFLENMPQRVNRDHVPYDLWERQGYLQTTEGNVVHYGFIEKFIESLGERFNIREIAFDRWGAVQMVQNLEGMGFTVVPFGQGFKDMSPPTKELMKLVLEGRIAHGGHPVLRWMLDNVCVRTDSAGNIKMDKEKSSEKIDGAVATVMALDRAIRCGNDTHESVYDSRGLLFV